MCPPIDIMRMSRKMTAKTKLYYADEFVALSRSTGVIIDQDDLEQFEKDGFLFPVPFDDQLTPLYSEDQIFILELLQREWKITLRHGDVKIDQELWVEKQKHFRKFFADKKEGLEQEIERRYRGIELYYGIKSLQVRQTEYANKETLEDMGELVIAENQQKYNETIKWHKEDWKKTRFQTDCKDFFTMYKTSTDELVNYAKFFARIGFSLDPFVRNWRSLFDHFKNKSIISREGGVVRYVYKCYSFTFNFLWLLEILKVDLTFEKIYKDRNLMNLFTYYRNSQHCVICSEIFDIKRKNQLTCGNSECIKESKRRNQALKRKAN